MSLADDFPKEMAQSCTIALQTGHDGRDPTHGTAADYDCHVKQEIEKIRDKDDNEVVSSCQIYLDKHPAVEENSKINYGGDSPPILKISRQWDERGNPYATIVFT